LRRTPRQQHQADARERRSEARHEFGGVGARKGGRGKPVIQNRLLPAIFVVEVRGEPVVPLDHFARGFGVERLVRVGDRLPAEAEKKCDERKKKKGEDRAPHAVALYVDRLCREDGCDNRIP